LLDNELGKLEKGDTLSLQFSSLIQKFRHLILVAAPPLVLLSLPDRADALLIPYPADKTSLSPFRTFSAPDLRLVSGVSSMVVTARKSLEQGEQEKRSMLPIQVVLASVTLLSLFALSDTGSEIM
jgi:hypothetical protein